MTVHDSFGCLAPRAERFRRIIREQFVRMYEEHDVLEEILDRAKGTWERTPAAEEVGLLLPERSSSWTSKVSWRHHKHSREGQRRRRASQGFSCCSR